MQERLSGRMGLEVKMNAYELADDLEGWSDSPLSAQKKENVFAEHAKMLRKQADEIKNLQEQFDKAIEFLAKANNMTRKQ